MLFVMWKIYKDNKWIGITFIIFLFENFVYLFLIVFRNFIYFVQNHEKYNLIESKSGNFKFDFSNSYYYLFGSVLKNIWFKGKPLYLLIQIVKFLDKWYFLNMKFSLIRLLSTKIIKYLPLYMVSFEFELLLFFV